MLKCFVENHFVPVYRDFLNLVSKGTLSTYAWKSVKMGVDERNLDIDYYSSDVVVSFNRIQNIELRRVPLPRLSISFNYYFIWFEFEQNCSFMHKC